MLSTTQLIIALSMPFFIGFLCRYRLFSFLSPTGTAYLVGIVASFTPIARDTVLSKELFNLSVGIAIVLMLLGSAPGKWLPYCTNYLVKTMAFFFILFFLGMVISFIWPAMNPLMGLFAATFVGSAPNMAAVGVGLGLSKDILLSAQTADIIICGVYFLIIITFKEKTFFPLKAGHKDDGECVATKHEFNAKNTWWIFACTVLVLGLSLIVASPFTDKQLAILICLNIISIVLAFFVPEQKLAQSYAWGEQVFLIFCFLLGSKLNFESFTGIGADSVFFGFAYLIVIMLVSMLFARLIGMDRDQFLILTSAGIFSPALIGPLVSMIKRKDLLGPGMAAASLGLTLGTFFGLGMIQLFQFLQ